VRIFCLAAEIDSCKLIGHCRQAQQMMWMVGDTRHRNTRILYSFT